MNFSLKTVSKIIFIVTIHVPIVTVNSGDNEHVASWLYIVNGNFVLIV